MKIAIHQNKSLFNHSITWDTFWASYCLANHIEFEFENFYSPQFLSKLKSYDGLLWNFQNNSYTDMQFARSILNVAEYSGVRVFPNYNTAWHYDDKVAQECLLEIVSAPKPKFWIFYEYKEFEKFSSSYSSFPVVFKLKCGAGSNNVSLLANKSDLDKKAKIMFSSGVSATPQLLFKAISNLKSTKNIATFIKRAKRIPEFLRTKKAASDFSRERGYLYLQEYIPNHGFDLKIVVVNDKLSFICRRVRKNDFRASGGGDLFFDRNLVPHNVIKSAFDLTDKLGFQCMGYDYVVDIRDGIGKVIEFSYAFSHEAVLMAGGYWNRNFEWVDEPLDVTAEIIKQMTSL